MHMPLGTPPVRKLRRNNEDRNRTRRHRALAASVLFVASIARSALAADVTSSWVVPSLSTGSWSVAANWANTPAVAQFPNNGNGGLTYDAVLANGGTALLTQNITLQNLTLAGNVLDGDSNLTVNQSMSWTGGGMRGAGTTTIPAGATLALTGTARRTLTRTLDNFGTVTWTGGGLTGDGALGRGTFNNNAGATLFANDSFISTGAMGIGTFNNAGTIIKAAGIESRFGGVTTFGNTGTLLVRTGLARFAGTMAQIAGTNLTGGTWIVDSTAAAGGTATLQFDRDSVTNLGPAARVELIGAGSSFDKLITLAGNQGSFRIASGKTFSTLGAYSNSGTTSVGTTSALEVNGELQNSGTVDISGGMIVRYPSTTSSPLATIRAQIVAAR